MNNLRSIILLRRSIEVTKKIGNAKSLGEMAILLSKEIQREVNKDKKLQLRGEIGNSRLSDFLRGPYICYQIAGGIEGNHKLENLVAELVVANMSQEPTPGHKKIYKRPSFAFLVAGLSALPVDDTMEGNFRQIRRSAYSLAQDLVTAAMAVADADTLMDIARGVDAVQEGMNHSYYSRHVVAALMAHRNLIDGGCAIPEKGQVRDEAQKILEVWRIPVSEDCARWRQVYQAAGLKDLPQSRPGRRKKD